MITHDKILNCIHVEGIRGLDEFHTLSAKLDILCAMSATYHKYAKTATFYLEKEIDCEAVSRILAKRMPWYNR